MTGKRQILIALVLPVALAFLGTIAGAADLADVPQGHWAYEAVSSLVDKGYLPVGEDRLFRGEEPVDRFTLATVVAKMLAEIESGRVSTTPEDVRTLRLVVEELRADLVKYYADVQRVEGTIEGAHQAVAAVDELLMQTIADLGDLYRRTLNLESLVANNSEADAQLAKEVGALRSALETLGASLGVDLQTLRADVDRLGEELDRRSYDLAAADAALGQEVTNLKQQTEALRKEDEALRQEIAALAESLRAEADALLAETQRLAAMIADERRAREADMESLMAALEQHGLQLVGQEQETLTQFSALRSSLQSLEARYIQSQELNDKAIAELEKLLAEVQSGVHDNVEGLAYLTYSLDQAEAKREALERRLEDLDSSTASRIADMEKRLEELKADSASDLAALEVALESLRVALEQDLAATDASVKQLDAAILERIEEVQQQIAASRESSARIEGRTAELEQALAELKTDLAAQVQSLSSDQASMRAEVNSLRQDVLMLRSQVGLSEEQVLELTQRVKEEMANQLTLSLIREGELQRALQDLRSEFDSFRSTSEPQLKTASSAQALSLVALAIGIISFLK